MGGWGVKIMKKRTPFGLIRRGLMPVLAVKGDKMFRSIWENGERGTPELWKIKPKTIYLYLYLMSYSLQDYPTISCQILD